jgi:hypothetical protein
MRYKTQIADYSYDKQGRVIKLIQEHKNIKNQKDYNYSQGNILKHIIQNDNIKKDTKLIRFGYRDYDQSIGRLLTLKLLITPNIY